MPIAIAAIVTGLPIWNFPALRKNIKEAPVPECYCQSYYRLVPHVWDPSWCPKTPEPSKKGA